MDLSGKSLIELAADLSAGVITQAAIRQQLGSGVLASVLGLGGGIVAGIAAQAALEALDRETGIVSDLGDVLDDAIGGVFSMFD